MRPNRYRAAALLLSGALLPLAACSKPPSPAVAQDAKPATSEKAPVVRAKAEDAPGKDEAKKDEAGDGFRFPDDKGGQLLAKQLPPSERPPVAHDSAAP